MAKVLLLPLVPGGGVPRDPTPGGGTDLERGYGDVQPWRLPFHTSPSVRKGPISSKSISSQGPLLRKFWNFSLYSLNFRPNHSSQAPKFGNFQLTSPQIGKFSVHKPQIWKFSAHKTPFSEASISSRAPHFRNPGRTPLPEKSWVPPRTQPYKFPLEFGYERSKKHIECMKNKCWVHKIPPWSLKC